MVEVHLRAIRVQQVQLMEHQQRELVVVLGVLQIVEAQAAVEIVEQLMLVEQLVQPTLVAAEEEQVQVLVDLVVEPVVQV